MIYHLCAKPAHAIEPGQFGTGVTRFDEMLHCVFPTLTSVAPRNIPALSPEDVVICDNHHVLGLPPDVPAIVVHHGCAATHYERDPAWRNESTREMVDAQVDMLSRPNTTFVAPSGWVAHEFVKQGPRPNARVIVNYVDPIPTAPRQSDRPLVIGDWRDFNKGRDHWQAVAAELPGIDFRPLAFADDAGRRAAYSIADAYLCLSLSEGGAYSVCDAEAAGLVIVSTDVGNAREFGAKIIENRDAAAGVADAVQWALIEGRTTRSYFETWTFERWAAAWRDVVTSAARGSLEAA